MKGVMVTANHALDFELAKDLAHLLVRPLRVASTSRKQRLHQDLLGVAAINLQDN